MTRIQTDKRLKLIDPYSVRYAVMVAGAELMGALRNYTDAWKALMLRSTHRTIANSAETADDHEWIGGWLRLKGFPASNFMISNRLSVRPPKTRRRSKWSGR